MHPIFDYIPYPLHREEARILHKILYIVINNPVDIVKIYNSCGPNLPPLNINQTPDRVWQEALENLAKAGLIKKLCELLIENTTSPPLEKAVQDVINAKSKIDEQVFSDKIFMLDRIDMRDSLKLLSDDLDPVKFLLIRGNSKSGKSHTRLLFNIAAAEKGAQAVYLCDGMVVTIVDVINKLFILVADGQTYQIPDRGVSTESAWHLAICIELQRLATKNQKYLWIAIDDLGYGEDNAPRLGQAIKDFFDDFVLQLSDPSFYKHFRLVLIHYPEIDTPSKWLHGTWEEIRISQNDIKQKDVEQLIKSWCTRKSLLILEEQVDKYAEKIIKDAEVVLQTIAGEKPLTRVERIYSGLKSLLKELSRISA